MMWPRVIPEVHRFAWLDSVPDILVLHVGGNDLGLHPNGQVIKDIQWDFLRLRSSFPYMIIAWSDIVARMSWRGARSVEKLNKARIKVNKEVGRFIARNGGVVVRHAELEVDTGLYIRGDGLHLIAVGIDLWSWAYKTASKGLFWFGCGGWGP